MGGAEAASACPKRYTGQGHCGVSKAPSREQASARSPSASTRQHTSTLEDEDCHTGPGRRAAAATGPGHLLIQHSGPAAKQSLARHPKKKTKKGQAAHGSLGPGSPTTPSYLPRGARPKRRDAPARRSLGRPPPPAQLTTPRPRAAYLGPATPSSSSSISANRCLSCWMTLSSGRQMPRPAASRQRRSTLAYAWGSAAGGARGGGCGWRDWGRGHPRVGEPG